MWRTPTVIPDVPPAGDIALHATWEQGVRGRKADGTDIIWPGYRGGQLHQSYILSAVRFHITWRYYDLPHCMWWLVRVEAIDLVSTNIDGVRTHVRGTGKRKRVTKFKIIQNVSSNWYRLYGKYVLLEGTVHAKIKLIAPSGQKCHQIKYNSDRAERKNSSFLKGFTARTAP